MSTQWLASLIALSCKVAGTWQAEFFNSIISFRHTKANTPVRALVFNGSELLAECERDPQFGSC
jgi:hypothetical protein